jgi:hypothetical protein
LSESTAWAIYRDRLKRFGSLIGDREPIVLHKEIPGMGRAKRYIITIADDDRATLDKLCRKLIAADATCDVLRASQSERTNKTSHFFPVMRHNSVLNSSGPNIGVRNCALSRYRAHWVGETGDHKPEVCLQCGRMV